MIKMSTGDDATLGNYLKMTKIVFGTDSKAVSFLEDKISDSPNGENEEVISDEGQMVFLLDSIHTDEKPEMASMPICTNLNKPK